MSFELPEPPKAPPAPAHEATLADGWRNAPAELRPVVWLLAVNLGLSIVLTVVTIFARHSIVNYQLAHEHGLGAQERASLRDSYLSGIVSRAVGNIVVSIVYVFLVRALLRGRRWAYRRVILLGYLGIAALVLTQFAPYPTWLRVEQLVQAVVLGVLIFFVTRPPVRAHFSPDLPGRMTGRFGRQPGRRR